MKNAIRWILCLAAAVVLLAPTPGPAAEWNPQSYSDESTLEYRSDCPDEGEHWSPVWLSVLDGRLYIALGSKAEARMSCNEGKTSVRIGEETFEDVRVLPAEDMAERIEAARSEKYWTNILVKGFEHKYYRLEPSAD